MAKLKLILFLVVVAACGKESPEPADGDDPGDMSTDMIFDSSTVDEGGPVDLGQDSSLRDASDVSDAADASDGGTVDYADPIATSGTRLRRRYFDGGDGAYASIDFWDSNLETSCSFDEAPDTALRCLPETTFYGAFLDAECTASVIYPIYFGCDDMRPWARLGDAYARGVGPSLGEQDVYRLDGRNCVPNGSRSAVRPAEIVELSQFVRGTAENVLRADDMVLRMVLGEDGSQWPLEVVHRGYGYTCEFDAQDRCRPAIESDSVFYLDDACSQPVVRSLSDRDVLVLNEEDGVCAEPRYFERGTSFTSASLFYRDVNGNCRAASSPWEASELGRELFGPEFPRARPHYEGTGQLLSRRRVDANGELLGVAEEFWETAVDERCVPLALYDGGTVCVTDSGVVISLYGSDDCDVPLGRELCSFDAPRYIVTGASKCSDFRMVYQVNERGVLADEVWGRSSGGSCTPRTDIAAPLWHLGPDITADLPRLVLEVEE